MRLCPKCKTSDYNNRFFVLMINECGHSLCRNCVDNLFARNSGPCPTCGRTLKKNGFWEQTFDDALVEKQVYWRKKLLKVYNLKEDDFDTLRAYNDYLEDFENVVCNLCFDVDVAETKKKVEEFTARNEQLIARNRSRKGADELWVEQQLLDEERAGGLRYAAVAEPPPVDAAADARALIDELRASDLPAELIVDKTRKRHVEAALAAQRDKRQRDAAAAPSSAAAPQTRAEPMARRAAAASSAARLPFVYRPVVIELDGPPPPSWCELRADAYVASLPPGVVNDDDQLHAGGYSKEMGCMRYLQEARCSLAY